MSKIEFFGESKLAKKNFANSFNHVPLVLIQNIALVKKCAASVNCQKGRITKTQSEAIIDSANEIILGKYNQLFDLSALQGGGGTSINMLVNEVISYVAFKKQNVDLHPLDIVNCSQSTNDVNPTALRIALLTLGDQIITSTNLLLKEIEQKAQTHKSSRKLGRTHLQDALSIKNSEEWLAWHNAILRALQAFRESQKYLNELPIGGTAIGTGQNAPADFDRLVVKALNKETGLELKVSKNKFSLISGMGDFVACSNSLLRLSLEISKIASDIRLLASGPDGGFSEIKLKKLQRGSSIMPGKVNPIIPEMVNQMYFLISGSSKTIELCAENAQLQLAVMSPVLSQKIIESYKIFPEVVVSFSKCLKDLGINYTRQSEQLSKSKTDIATRNALKNGYSLAEKKLAYAEGGTRGA